MENNIEKKDLQKLEESAIIKYEKGVNRYRGRKYQPIPKRVVCQKCGSPYNLTKTTIDNIDYWFCKHCIEQRAREIQIKNNKIIPEREL